MIDIKRIFLFIILTLSLSSSVFASSLLTRPTSGINFAYDWVDMQNYQANTVSLDSNVSVDPHQFYYDFSYIYGRSMDSLLSFGAGYGYKEGNAWIGGGISSSGIDPFSALNTVDFNVFFAYRLIQRITQYAEGYDGQMHPFYLNLYLGVEYDTSRILLDAYPLPVIRFEYGLPKFNLILGLPLTYFNIRLDNIQFFEITYTPVLNFEMVYGIRIHDDQTLKFSLDIEQKQYRSNVYTSNNAYFMYQTKYYTEFIKIKAHYDIIIADVLTVSPYLGFIPSAKTYYGKTFDSYSNVSYLGIGYTVGINLNIKI